MIVHVAVSTTLLLASPGPTPLLKPHVIAARRDREASSARGAGRASGSNQSARLLSQRIRMQPLALARHGDDGRGLAAVDGGVGEEEGTV